MLYALLIIIAIGVLLISEEGKKLLGIITWLLVIGGVLYLGFWIVVSITALFSGYKGFIINGLAILGLCWMIYDFYGAYKRGKFSKQSIKNWWIESWEHHRWAVIIFLIFFVFVIILLISNLIMGSGWLA